MQCLFHQHLSTFIDRELDPVKAKEVREHLQACAECRAELDLLLEIRNSLREAATSSKAPASLKEKILGEAPQGKRTVFMLPRKLAYALPMVAVLLAAAIVSVYYYRLREGDSFRDIVAIMAQYHSAYESESRSPSIESSGLKDIGVWLKRNLDIEILIPRAAFAGYNLVGADIFEHGGRKFAYLKYQENGKTIGYVVCKDFALPIDLPETMEIGGITFHIGQIEETHVGVWKKGGLIYAILTTEDRSELIEYAQKCIQLF